MLPTRQSHTSIDNLALAHHSRPVRVERNVFCIPAWFIDELRKLMPLFLPLLLALQLNFTLFTNVVTFFTGHMGELELAGTSLAMTAMNFGQQGVFNGVTTACDTLFSQAYGAGKRKKIGIYLQQGLLFMILISLMIGTMFLLLPRFMVVLGIDAGIAKYCGDYVLFLIPGMLGNAFFQVLTKYLLFQNHMSAVTGVSIVGNILNIVLHYVFIITFDLGIIGSALSISLTNWLMFFLTVAYVIVTGLYVPTWPGWSFDCFRNWNVLARYAVPGVAMTSLESVGYELGAIMSAMLGPVYASAMLIYSQIAYLHAQFFAALGVSCSVRVAYCLGANDVITAKRVCFVSCLGGLVMSVVPMMTNSLGAAALPRIFTDQENVIEVTSIMLYISVLYAIPNALSAMQFAILRGCGRQTIGAVVTLGGYFGLGLPLAVVFMFYTPLKGPGFVAACTVCLVAICLVLSLAMKKTDWTEQTEKAKALNAHDDQENPDEETGLLSGVKPIEKLKELKPKPKESFICTFIKRLLTFSTCLLVFLSALYYKYLSGELDCVFSPCTNQTVITTTAIPFNRTL